MKKMHKDSGVEKKVELIADHLVRICLTKNHKLSLGDELR